MAIFRNQLVNDGAKTSTYSNGRTTAPKPAVSTTSKSAVKDYAVNKSTTTSAGSGNMGNMGSFAYTNKDGSTTYGPKDAYVSSRATPQQVATVYQKYGVPPFNKSGGDDEGSRGDGGGSGGSSSIGSSGGGGGDYSSSSSSIESALDRALRQREEELQKQRDLLAEQERKAKEAYQAQYEMQRARNKEAHRDNADQINLNRIRAEILSRSQFGSDSGANNTNMARIGAGWASDHNKNNRSLQDNDSIALADLNRNLSNAYNTLASGYSNFILPVTTNDINYLRELQYRRDANALDYDYRKFLTNAGLM